MNTELSEFYKDKTVLITGGLGFIGSNLSRRLISLGADAVIIDDITTRYATNLKGFVLGKDYMFYEASVTSRNWVNELVLHADIIFHLAARNIIASTENPQDDFETNIGGTLNILLALKEFPFKRMVYTSSTSVYGNPRYLPINEDDNINLLTPYAVSKYSAEGYCMAFHENYWLYEGRIQIQGSRVRVNGAASSDVECSPGLDFEDALGLNIPFRVSSL